MMSAGTREQLHSLATKHEAEVLDLAGRLVRIRSANPTEGEREIADFVVDWLRKNTSMSVSIAAKEAGRPNVVARLNSGNAGRSLMLSGHLDTKPAGDPSGWSFEPLVGDVQDGRLRGRGAADMKASVAAMMVGAKTLENIDGWAGSLILVLTADEEAGGTVGARYLAEDQVVSADAGIIGEPAGVTHPYEFIALACRGGCWIETRIRGIGGHSSLARPLGLRNPNHRIGPVLEDMQRRFAVRHREKHAFYPDGVLYNFGARVVGGDGPGTVPHETVILSDIRVPPGVGRGDVEDAVHEYNETAAEDVSVKLVKFSNGVETSSSERVARAAADAARTVLGRKVPFSGYPAGTDAVHFMTWSGMPCVTAFGPGLLTQAHVPDESIDVESVVAASHMYPLAAFNYLTPEVPVT